MGINKLGIKLAIAELVVGSSVYNRELVLSVSFMYKQNSKVSILVNFKQIGRVCWKLIKNIFGFMIKSS